MTRVPADANSARNTPIVVRVILEQGFSLVEFMISSLILTAVAGAVFGLLSQTQRTASFQTEMQAVLDNTRIAMDTVARILQQAGNDPLKAGFPGVSVTSQSEVRIRTDVTGSAPGEPDKGDPDGDTNDSNEDLTIRYSSSSRTIELVTGAGVVQSVASNISAFTLTCFDNTGNPTSVGSDVRRVRISLSGASPVPDPQTGRVFGLSLVTDVQLATRE